MVAPAATDLALTISDRSPRSNVGSGAGVTIAVLDDAVDTRHPEFDGRVGLTIDIADGGSSVLPRGWQPHGTKVAGLALAAGIKVRGAAPEAQLMAIRTPGLGRSAGDATDADAIRWAAEHGADVICCAWGPPNPTAESARLADHARDALDWAITHGRDGRGCVVVFSAGNDGCDLVFNGYGNHPGVIAVGACNHRQKRPSYSGWGQALWCVVPSNDPRDPAGAGMTYTTTAPLGSFLLGQTFYTGDFGFTSASCAIAAGVCAQILSVDPSLTSQDVREIIARSCQKIDLEGGSYDEHGHSPDYGFGRLDPARAVQLALEK